MRGARITERTPLTRPTDTPEYVEFASLLRTRRSRIKQFQCCVCATFIAVFTMALVMTISYSVSHDIIDGSPNLTESQRGNLSGSLKLGFAPGNPLLNVPGSPLILTDAEFKEGLEAGRQAIEERLSADAAALASPLPSPSPESRHRYAVSTCYSVGALALAGIGELAATKRIETARMMQGEVSSFGSFFDGGWVPTGICKELQVLNCTASKYRTFDGSCNRPKQWGASLMPFRRVLAPSYADGIDVPRKALSGKELPSAREISLKVHKPSPSSNPAFTVMLAVYGQFLDHDITATAISQGANGSSISCCPPSVGHPECFPVRVAAGDPVFDVANRKCMEFVRSAPAPQCKLGPREQLNQVTAFIDGSTIYGVNVETSSSLREFAGGRLRMQKTPDNRTLLPASTDPNDGCNRETERLRGRYCFAAGDARANENLHLTTMHLLWARQHNRIANELAKINPTWDDETLYQETRRIIGAQLQHITYQEFVPIVLGERETNLRQLRPLKSGYRESTESFDDLNNDPTIANHFASAAFRFAHTLLPGLMRVTDEEKGASSYVELHRMLFNPYSLYAEDGVRSSVRSATGNVIQMTTTHVTSQLTNHLFEDPIGNGTVPCGLDLVSLNIQRGRDHGLPGYTRWREHCGLGKVEAFSDLSEHLDPQVLAEISMLYESVGDVDLYTGALGELPTPGGIVGPTFTCLIADQFARLQKGDRFWYEVGNQPHSFSKGQLTELRKTSLARLICDCSDGVAQIQPEVMRSVGTKNPMMSCEDIPGPSFGAWKDDVPQLQAPFAPVNWTDFKKNINDTVRDLVTFINNTKSSETPLATDWLAFKNYINDTFADLKNDLAGLHPPKVETPEADKFLLQAATPTAIYQDWINFKTDLVKSLNNSMATIGGGPAAAAKWAAFKQNIASQFTDLKDQFASAKAEVTPKLLLQKYKEEQAARMLAEAAIPATFDWKNFKDNIASSIDDTIVSIGDKMPPAGDPAWATFEGDLKDRFSALRDKINAQRPVPVESATGSDDWLAYKADVVSTVNDAVQKIKDDMPPPGDPAWATFGTEVKNRFAGLRNNTNGQKSAVPLQLAGEPGFSGDWLAYKADVTKTVNAGVQQIKDAMPPPGDPAWATYRDEIAKSFSAFRTTTPATEFATLAAVPERAKLQTVSAAKFTKNELSNLTTDWLEFRGKINDSLTRVIQDIQSKRPTTVDPLGWTAFKDSAMNDFAQLKNEIISTKTEWINKIKSNETGSLLKAAGNYTKFDYTKFLKPVIPPEDWINFKKEINDTVINFLHAANATETVDFEEMQKTFNKSFADLKKEISSLKDFILKNVTAQDTLTRLNSSSWNKTSADWVNFRAQLNSTVNELIERLKNESSTAIGNVMKILFNAKDKLANLEPPSPAGIPPDDWAQYASGLNKTVTETLKNVSDFKRVALMIKAAGPAASSSARSSITSNLLLPCVVLLQLIPQIRIGC